MNWSLYVELYLDVNLSTVLSAVIVNADITRKRLTKKYIPSTVNTKKNKTKIKIQINKTERNG